MEGFPISYNFTRLVLLLTWSLIVYLYYSFWWRPELRLRKQGIRGPPPNFLLGNIPEIKQAIVQNRSESTPSIEGDSFSGFPSFKQWCKKYGNTYMFKLGTLHFLYATNPFMVKEMKLFRSLDLGKPAYLQKDRGVLLGKGIITTNGPAWSHQRKILSPRLSVDKDTLNIIVESGSTVIKSWERILMESKDGLDADIMVDGHMRSFTSCIISKLMFGHDHCRGMNVTARCHTLFKAMGTATTIGIPFLRYLPTKANRNAWRLAKEIHSMILDIAKDRCGSSTTKDILQVILEGSENDGPGPSNAHEFIVDNCKDMLLAASEGTAISAMWGLMLLASNPEWQARARSEVKQVCGGHLPNFNMLGKMKVLKMVILEVLRLYPPVALVSRRALQDVKLCDMQVPKGVNIWIWAPALHRDPDLWGPDADKFNPERFIDGVSGACKSSHAYIPFGVGARLCPGNKLGMIQLKVLLAMILSNFNLSISTNYRHSPTLGLLLEPEHGVNLVIQKI
ncbi:PREDICTED: cytochrome P450 714C2-like [Populus euphratica]|uniref:Cytochrome P450 714C2-like n=1 Tax=Populus euphratica TaxID=75702 RepID=A0AAJ6V0M3_POPEU|nr:PREDICTED: cytochrome P450 714C2-like [Populus euphratica]XP_011038701.1 PREDICTED: cytochrome P450 714C2-like [Populus euphratica]